MIRGKGYLGGNGGGSGPFPLDNCNKINEVCQKGERGKGFKGITPITRSRKQVSYLNIKVKLYISPFPLSPFYIFINKINMLSIIHGGKDGGND